MISSNLERMLFVSDYALSAHLKAGCRIAISPNIGLHIVYSTGWQTPVSIERCRIGDAERPSSMALKHLG